MDVAFSAVGRRVLTLCTTYLIDRLNQKKEDTLKQSCRWHSSNEHGSFFLKRVVETQLTHQTRNMGFAKCHQDVHDMEAVKKNGDTTEENVWEEWEKDPANVEMMAWPSRISHAFIRLIPFSFGGQSTSKYMF